MGFNSPPFAVIFVTGETWEQAEKDAMKEFKKETQQGAGLQGYLFIC